ncbi:MAG: phosphate ABC transporter permease subunit PstC [Candidatus Kapabacteria bacterium]|nr:phosphate ABC transporter permease subunit PstC [Candidatus Kapabacteria bacterium]
MSDIIAARSGTSSVRTLIGEAQSRIGDRVFYALCVLASVVILATIAGILFQLVSSSQLSIAKFGFGFLTGSTWDPVMEEYGARPFIYGTVVSSLMGLALALPLSIGIAVFLVEVAGLNVRTIASFLVETLAAIPSVVYGVWGVFVMVPFIQEKVGMPLAEKFGESIPLFAGPAVGPSLLSAAVILAIMIIPIITSITRDVMLAIPMSQREAAFALGSTKWEAIKIVIANARWGILGGIILGLGRALGETMAVTLVIGNSPYINSSILQPSYTMASVIANEFTEATSDMYLSALIEVGLVLLITTFVVNMLARFLVWSVTRRSIAGGRQ